MTGESSKSFSIGWFNWKSSAALMVFISVIIFFLAVQSDGKPSLTAVAISTGVLGLIVLQMVVSKITVEKDKLIAGGGLYKVKVPWSEINIDEVVRLAPDDSFRLGWRKNGIGWPGYCVGWFGSSKKKNVFVATSGRDNLVYIPTRKSFDIVVTPSDPDDFLDTLRRISLDSTPV